MFHVSDGQVSRLFRLSMCGLALLSLSSLIVTAWILVDVQHEQEIFQKLMKHLPASDKSDATEMAGELKLQSRLTILLILNIIATTVALTVFIRAYLSAKRSLRDVKVLATDILASMDIGVITTDKNRLIMSMNPFGRELVNNNKTDIDVGSKLEKLSSDHEPLQEICEHVLKNHDCVRDQDYEIHQNGHSRTLRAGCSLLRDVKQNELGTVIHVRDVTEKVLIDRRLSRMERYMGLGSLAAGLHHEIKNPLSALSLHVQLLRESLIDQNPSPELLETLDVLTTEVSRITNVLERFRDYASISELHLEQVDLKDLIQRLVRLITPQAKQKNIRIEVEIPNVYMPRVSVDSVSFEQVLLNLAVNAIEAMPEGGVLTFQLEQTDEKIKIQVKDTGVGIPPDLRERIFDPYFTTRNSGTGMGLAICEKIVQLHQGIIDFVTGPEGTTFTVSLNLDKNNEF